MDVDRVMEEGYWPLTQAIVRSILPFGRADDEGREVLQTSNSSCSGACVAEVDSTLFRFKRFRGNAHTFSVAYRGY